MRNRSLKLALMVMLASFTIVTMASQSYAVNPDNPMVGTYDIYDNPTEVFNIGDTVRIKVYSHYFPYDIFVNDQNNVTVWSDTSYTGSYTTDLKDITTALGWWNVRAGTVETHFAVAWYHVIPEMPLGVLAVLGACFTGLGFRRVRQTKKAK